MKRGITMNTTSPEPNFNQHRSDAIERLLSATVEATTIRRPIRRTAAIGIGSAVVAFALAGALTGAAVASTIAPHAGQQLIDNANQAAGVGYVVEQNSKLIGQPFTTSGTGKMTIDLGTRPAGANAIVEASTCSDPGTFNEHVDTNKAQTICDPSDTGVGNVGTGSYPVTTGGNHTYSVTTTPGAHYSVWLSWINYPTLSPSAAEKSAIADGVVTRDEYVAAFNQYLGCMAGAGHPVTGYDESSAIIQYSPSTDAVNSGADNRCYQTQFRAVNELWQTEDGGSNSR
jgi:hypothetical protein